MQDTAATDTMHEVHRLLVDEFGRLAPPLEEDDTVQKVYLPGGEYALVVRPTGESAITIAKCVGKPDFDTPGLSEFLLREHGTWLFGRLERVGDVLGVAHTIDSRQLDAASLARVVQAVQAMAVGTERLLERTGAMTVLDADDEQHDEQYDD
jgi:hypothetical protein